MNPTKKKIKINGKLVTCRALKIGENRRKGDVYECGSLVRVDAWPTQKWTGEGNQAYRPLPTPKRKKAGVKVKAVNDGSFIAYGRTSQVGKFIRFEMTLDLCEGKSYSAYRVTPIRKARKK